MTGAPIHVVLAFDDGFWAPAYAVMRSIALSSRRPADLRFHLLCAAVGERHRAQIEAITTEFPVTLNIVALEREDPYREFTAALPVRKPFTAVIYARLLLDALLPGDVTRVVYLDCDTLVRSPIENLAEVNLWGKSIGAVLDPHRHVHMLGRDLKANADVFDFGFPYFNSGVLLIDRVAYGHAKVPDRTRELAAQGLLDRLQYDQAALNLIFRNDWLPLDHRWNLINPEPAHEVLEPHIVHYTGPRKPWGMLPGAAYGRLYRHVMTNRIFHQFQRERRRSMLRVFGSGR